MTQIDIRQIVQLQNDTVALWHTEDVNNTFSGLNRTICQQHSFNYLLWHQEDIARCPNVSDSEIADVKRNIDQLNQQRNDWIERIDDEITEMLESAGISDNPELPLNTETPGSVIDRLSIMSLRIYHLDEQLERDDVDQAHMDSVLQKIAICKLQQSELGNALQQLLNDIFAGKKRHRTYRQFKMYNDPALNPYLYQVKEAA